MLNSDVLPQLGLPTRGYVDGALGASCMFMRVGGGRAVGLLLHGFGHVGALLRTRPCIHVACFEPHHLHQVGLAAAQRQLVAHDAVFLWGRSMAR